ncbi:DNA helicase II / ATP-dependent DNA helicase PcrA [Rhizoctonia solani]|uniref:DNA 3'-5' helicase n=1 Tax=Rhizoctonia solani TaxID=456999 RepID=A0A0K6GCZ5_9AGAM|nr:DNA helicase II / ATP-dependent DNA helicase PcrA [Rhizoctonia solani]
MQLQTPRFVPTKLVHTLIPNRNTTSRRHLTFTISRATNHQQSISEHVAELNEQQNRAVFSNPFGTLQILAGPGTGKTRVMAVRTAKLIIEDGIPPELIFLVTFGRHPAQELRVRLNSLIGPELTDRLQIGTIHRTCLRYIKNHMNPSVSLWDDVMCQQNIGHITKLHVPKKAPFWSIALNIQDAIARMKVYKGSSKSQPELVYRSSRLDIDYHTFQRIISDNQKTMKHSNALDFDDLVNECRELIEHKPSLVSRTRHILVDEFQDTNMAQYKLIRSIARASNSGITVVGDPDQAIFGWRFADTANFQHMCVDFPHTRVINLETNYRSTPSILDFSHAIIAQDKSRPTRSLYSLKAHPVGPLPNLHKQPTIQDEANSIASYIHDLYQKCDGALQYGDIAILLRYNIWKLVYADSLKQKGIPFQILPKSNFYAKNSVLDTLAYVFLAFSPQATPWLLRILDNTNTIDSETVKNIQRHALTKETTAVTIVRQMVDKNVYKINLKLWEQLQRLVGLLDYIREEGENGTQPSLILEYIIQHEFFRNQLKRRMRVGGFTFAEGRNDLQSLVQAARRFEQSGVMKYSTMYASMAF